MKSVSVHRKVTKNPPPTAMSDAALRSCDEETHIAVTAYYKAEARGFAPGHELEDWLAAEAEEKSW